MSKGTRIMVIEDNAANLELMRYLLETFGYRTLSARGGEEGIALAASERPNLVLCDVQMPGVDGYEVLRRVRGDAKLASIPVVAVTALAMVGDRARALAAGFDGYLTKPIDPETFVADVERFLPARLRNPHPDPAPVASRAPADPLPPARATILAVDNLQVNLDLLSSLFHASGYRVISTVRAEEAIRLARESPPDLILSDVAMSEGSGYDLIAAVKSDPRLKAIPFVLITSTFATESERRKGLALGAARFLFRPIEPQRLLQEIEDCLLEGSAA